MKKLIKKNAKERPSETKVQLRISQKTRRKDFENITKSRHFSVISESQIIGSYKRLANQHEETQKKYAKEKPERKVQLRLSPKHVGKISKT